MAISSRVRRAISYAACAMTLWGASPSAGKDDFSDLLRMPPLEQRLLGMKDAQGHALFDKDTAKQFIKTTAQRSIKAYEAVGLAEKIFSFTDSKGDPLFTAAGCTTFVDNGGTVDYIEKMASARNNNGDPYFTGQDITWLWYREKDKSKEGLYSYAQTAILTADLYAGKGFTGADMVRFTFGDVGLQEALAFRKKGFSASEAYRYRQLGYTPETACTFIDTGKPNAVVVYPTADWNGGFDNNAAIDIFHRLQDRYDIALRIATREDEAYAVIEEIQNIELLGLAGHGTKTTLSLGEADRAVSKGEKDETYMIDLTDNELRYHLDKLNPNAVIFLDSCSNGEGGEKEDNLANFVSLMACRRTVISSTAPFGANQTHIESVYPFRASIAESFSFGSQWALTYRPHEGLMCTFSREWMPYTVNEWF